MYVPTGLSYGWSPDIPDFRDHVEFALPTVPAHTAVNLREDGLEPARVDACGVHASCSFALLAMLDWQARKWTGSRVDASASFLHQLTLRVVGGGGIQGVSLRSTLKVLRQYGAPPEHMWPSRPERFTTAPASPELFGFARMFQMLRYERLDAWSYDPLMRLSSIRRWVANGNPCLIGFAVPTTIMCNELDSVPFDVHRGGTGGGSACIVMGYDDHFRLPSPIHHSRVSPQSRVAGALLIKTCWGDSWGNQGYGWLPYAFVESRFACDAWAVMHEDWI